MHADADSPDASVIRWLHLSDFHVGKDDYGQRRMFTYILDHVKTRQAHGFVPDLVLITGDLANRGKDDEYLEFWLEFYEPLAAILPDLPANRVFVTPGNHDVDREKHPAFSREDMVAPGNRYFDPTDEGLSLREILAPRFRAFVESDLTTERGCFADRSGGFAVVLDVNGAAVGVAGVNTAWLSKDDHDERKLTPGKALLEHALCQLASVDVCILLGHHPIECFAPEQQKPIKSLLGKHSAVYLHGHLHHVWAEPSYGGGYQFLTIQSGAAFQTRESDIWRNGLVWAEVSIKSEEGSLTAIHVE